jgi:hypothetical protein
MKNTPAPGWVARLDIPEASRAAWEHQLQPPFDPYIERIGEGAAAAWVLRSELFDGLSNAEEVWGRALPLVEQLNGAQRISRQMQSVQCNGVGRVDSDGKLSITQFAGAHFKGNAMFMAVLEQGDAQGNLIVSPPRVSEVQRWVQEAQANDDIADLLRYLASADNWYDIYKAFEVVEAMVGRQTKLEQMLGPDAKGYKVARQSSNFYRHARTSRPAELISLEEARTRLVHVVRTIAARFLGSK